MDSSESNMTISLHTLIDENIGRFFNNNLQSDEIIKDMFFNRGRFHIVCTKEAAQETIAAFQRMVTDIHTRITSAQFLEIFGIHRNYHWKFPYVEALDTVGANKIIRNKLSFACPDDIDQSVFDEFISNQGYSQEVAQVPDTMHRCPRFTYTNKRQVVPVELDPKLNSEKFWAAKYQENKKVPANVSTSTAKTTTSSLSKDSKSMLDKMDKKFTDALCKEEQKHKEELSKMKSSFELQLNKLKS